MYRRAASGPASGVALRDPFKMLLRQLELMEMILEDSSFEDLYNLGRAWVMVKLSCCFLLTLYAVAAEMTSSKWSRPFTWLALIRNL